MAQQTLVGIGLHSGAECAVTLERVKGPTLIRQEGGAWHALSDLKVGRTDYGVELLASDFRVDTVEHLLAALAGLAVHAGVRIHVLGPEIPLLGGSAERFVAALDALGVAGAWGEGGTTRGGVRSEPKMVICRTAERRVGDAWYSFTPSAVTEIEVEVRFSGVGTQTARWDGSEAEFRRALAPARTFGFRRDGGPLRASGRARFVDTASVIVLEDDGTVLPGGAAPRDSELARHKLLDLLGDLYLYGGVPGGRLHAVRPGHTANHAVFSDANARGIWTRQ